MSDDSKIVLGDVDISEEAFLPENQFINITFYDKVKAELEQAKAENEFLAKGIEEAGQLIDMWMLNHQNWVAERTALVDTITKLEEKLERTKKHMRARLSEEEETNKKIYDELYEENQILREELQNARIVMESKEF